MPGHIATAYLVACTHTPTHMYIHTHTYTLTCTPHTIHTAEVENAAITNHIGSCTEKTHQGNTHTHTHTHTVPVCLSVALLLGEAKVPSVGRTDGATPRESLRADPEHSSCVQNEEGRWNKKYLALTKKNSPLLRIILLSGVGTFSSCLSYFMRIEGYVLETDCIISLPNSLLAASTGVRLEG